MPHANARLTEYARLLAVRRVEQGHKPGEVFQATRRQPADDLQVSPSTPRGGRRRPDRPVVPAAPQSPTHAARGGAADRAPASTSTPGRRRCPGCCNCRPRRSVRCCAVGSCRTWGGSIASPASSSATAPPTSATNGTDPVSCCMSTSRSLVGSPTASGGGCTAASRSAAAGWLGLRARRRRRPHPHRLRRGAA